MHRLALGAFWPIEPLTDEAEAFQVLMHRLALGAF